jgi:hypothetical protein
MIRRVIETAFKKNGIAASLMDYARLMHRRQRSSFIRQMGPYDHYAVNWGYRVIQTWSLLKQKFLL